jgi:hypothetical protein
MKMHRRYFQLPTFALEEPGGGGGGNTPPANPPANPPKTFTQAELDGIIAERLARATDKYRDHDTMKAELEQLKKGQMTEAEKTAAKLAEAEKKAAEAEAKLKAAEVRDLKLAALTKLGLSPSFASRIGGEDAKAIEEDAKELQKLLGGTKAGGGSAPAAGQTDGNASVNRFIREQAGRA